ncbi:hypothetical protein [Cupriavidus sp. BIS7]|uniref:hypothetical protein n=1 Tax=Cupriavidus sp. BIS7 TaxID=1217718 RepID=UPI0002DF486F|nr:hypothetical protein [Cupriavidus sp. BIS7]
MSANHSRRRLLLTLGAAPVALGGFFIGYRVRAERAGIALRWLSEEVFPSILQRLDALQARRTAETGADA